MSALTWLWGRRKSQPAFVIVAFVTLSVLFVYPFVDWWLRSLEIAAQYRYYDFGAFYTAVNRWQTGAELYQQTDTGGYHGTFLYPPVVLLLYLPFDGMGVRDAAASWDLLSLGLLWIGLQLVIDALGYELRLWERGGLLLLLIGFQPLALSLKLGQMAPFMTALLCFALVGLVGGDASSKWLQYSSGFFTATVGFIKLTYAPVGAHLLQNRARFLGAVGAGGVLVGTSLLVFGMDLNRTYLDVLAWGVGRGTDARPPTLWLPPYYRPLHWLPAAQWLRFGASLVVAGCAVLAPRDTDRLVFALGVTAFPLLTPLGYTYYFVALLPAVAVLLAEELDCDGYVTVPIAGLLLVHLHAHGLKLIVDALPSLFPPMEFFAPYWILQPGLWGNLLLFGLAFLRVVDRITIPVLAPDVQWDTTERET